MLTLAVATLLSASDVEWCSADCFGRAHPVSARAGLSNWGGVDIVYAIRLMSFDGKPGQAVERLQLSWALPFSDVLEIDAGASVDTNGQFELMPGGRYSVIKLGGSLVFAVATFAAISWHADVLQISVWPSVELRLGPTALQVALQWDASGRTPASIWCGMVLGL
jgi:hypothetical protein